MCGIVGYVGNEPAAPVLLSALHDLEYRGYDSAGIAVLEPDGGAAPQHLLTAIQGAQDAGHIDSSWAPLDLLVMLFGIALAWAQFPDASSAWNDPATLATRRAAAIDAAKRLLAPPR